MPKIQTDIDCYRIVGDAGEEGDPVDYGCQATLDTDNEHLTALVDLDDKDEPKTCLAGGAWVVDSKSGERYTDVEIEEVEFDEGEAEAEVGVDDDDEDEDDEEDGDDEDDNAVTLPEEEEEDQD